MINEQASELARKAINILFVANPKGTSIGILLGVISHGAIGLFSPILKTIEVLNFAAIKMWHLICLGVVSINLPLYFRRKEIDPSIRNALEYIEKQKAAGTISDWQAKQMYVNLHQRVLENVVLDNDQKGQMEKIDSFFTSTESRKNPNK